MDQNDTNLPEILVLLIQNLKKDPFEKLINISYPITTYMTKKYYLTAHEREDLTQEARSVLNEAVNSYDIQEGMPFLQYYQMSLSNHFNMLLRKEETLKRKINKETVSLDELVEEAGVHIQGTSPVTTYPEEAAIANETYSNYLIELSPLEKEIFTLFLDGVLQEKIAEKLNISLKQVRSALYRCSVKFKSAVND